jgi:adenosylhomocysteine nucleosidase
MWLRFLVNTWVRQQAQQTFQGLVAEALRGEAPPERRPGASRSRPTAPGSSTESRLAGERHDDQTLDDQALATTGESPSEPRPPCSILFLFALELEAAGFIERLREVVRTQCATFVEHDGFLGEARVIVGETGVGMKAARRATEDLLALHRPAWVVSAGFAGGLAEPVRKGHFVMTQQVVNEAGQALNVGLKLPPETLAAQKSLHAGRLLSVDRLIREEAEKRQLARQHEAVACDMETWAIADACAAQKTRFISVRVITDAVDDELPREVENLLEQKSLAGKLGAVAGALLNRPSSVKDMWKLYEEAQRGSSRLAKFLEGTAAQLR